MPGACRHDEAGETIPRTFGEAERRLWEGRFITQSRRYMTISSRLTIEVYRDCVSVLDSVHADRKRWDNGDSVSRSRCRRCDASRAELAPMKTFARELRSPEATAAHADRGAIICMVGTSRVGPRRSTEPEGVREDRVDRRLRSAILPVAPGDPRAPRRRSRLDRSTRGSSRSRSAGLAPGGA